MNLDSSASAPRGYPTHRFQCPGEAERKSGNMRIELNTKASEMEKGT